MEIIVADYSGFCFGVKNAVSTAYNIGNKYGRVFTYGPIIHNSTVVNELEQKGIVQLNSMEDLKKGDTVIIRSHGVSKDIIDTLEKKDVKIINATCPYVNNIQRIVNEYYKKNYSIVIIGDRDHPEVQGTNSWCDNSAIIINNVEDAKNLEGQSKLCIVAQTTMHIDRWKSILCSLLDKSKELVIFNTICSATEQRQKAARELAQKCDSVIVLGGLNSSNTRKLVEICREFCPRTYHVESINELNMDKLEGVKILGISAGASTPDWIIKEAIDKMDNLKNTNEEYNEQIEQSSLMSEYEKTFIRLHTGDIVKGRIIYTTDDEATVDVGYKADGIITKDELSIDGNISPKDLLKSGDEIDVYVLKVNDGEGNVLLSKKRVDVEKNWDYIDECFTNKTVVEGKVTQVVKGGVIAEVKGINMFIPASQANARYTEDLSGLMGKTVQAIITSYDADKRRVVGSRRIVLEEEIKNRKKQMLETIEVGNIMTGTVSRLTDFGAFIDLGGIDGLIHISELSWTRVKHPSDVMKEGEKVEVYVLSVDKDKERISLSLKKTMPEPWEDIENRLKIGDIVDGKVVRIAPFGVFIEIEKGVDGLVHISQISEKRINRISDVLKIGDNVKAMVTEINVKDKKINLSMREAVNEENKKENEILIDGQIENNITIGDAISNKESE